MALCSLGAARSLTHLVGMVTGHTWEGDVVLSTGGGGMAGRRRRLGRARGSSGSRWGKAGGTEAVGDPGVRPDSPSVSESMPLSSSV